MVVVWRSGERKLGGDRVAIREDGEQRVLIAK
jgi:hypothetical protein